MPVNAHPEYIQAEKDYLGTKDPEEKIEKLKVMISYMPKHKSAENLRAQLRTRLKKLQEELEKKKKKKIGKNQGIKKGDFQVVLIGLTKSGKSSLLSLLTNAKPKISDIPFETKKSVVGIMNYASVNIQIIEIPSFNSEYYDKSIANTADTILIIVEKLEEIKEIEKGLTKAFGKRIIVVNKIDNLDENELRRLEATLKTKKYSFCLISAKNLQGIEELKEKIFHSFDKIRVYTKEPGKEKSDRPIILEPNSSVLDVAEKILKGLSQKIKETKIWGPSSKFAGQIVGLSHKLKDLDVVEFKTR